MYGVQLVQSGDGQPSGTSWPAGNAGNGNVGVTYEWEAIQKASVDYHIITELIGPDGQSWSDEELALGGRNVNVTALAIKSTVGRSDARG